MAASPAERILLVCSPGGHLLQMRSLRAAYEGREVMWVTLRAADVEHLLRDEQVVFAHGPTNRSIGKLLRNLRLAWRLVRQWRPDAILSTGAGPAVPFFVVGKLLGCRLVYVESLTRVSSLSLSGRMVYPLSDEFFVQWPGARRGRARHVGNIL